MRTFQLHRDVDTSGVSGTGIVAEGVEFESGKVLISWLTKHTSVGMYDSMEVVLNVHGHGGQTRIVWTAGDEMRHYAAGVLMQTAREIREGQGIDPNKLDELARKISPETAGKIPQEIGMREVGTPSIPSEKDADCG